MSAPITIKLTTTGPGITGPFSIYCTQDGVPYTPALITGITLTQLQAGYYFILPTGCSGVRVESDGIDCTNYIDFFLATTSTTTSTTAPPPIPCRCHQVQIVGTSTISWKDCENITQSDTFTNVTVKICAKLGSVTYVGGTVTVIPGSTDCINQIDCWDEFVMEVQNISSLLFNVVASTDIYAIEWKPGVYNMYTAGTAARSYTYSSPFTGFVKIKAPSLTFITRLILTTGSVPSPGILNVYGPEIAKLTKLTELDIGYGTSNARLFCSTSDLSTSTLTKLRVFKGTVTGDIAALPNVMTDLQLYGSTTVFGNIQDLPTTLQTLAIYGSNTLSGNLANLPVGNKPTLKIIEILGQNTITGSIGGFAGYTVIQTIRLEGLNTITGNISGLSGLTTLINFSIYGKNKLTGDLISIVGLNNLQRFVVDNNSIYLSPTVGNDITGDIANIPNSVKVFILGRYNTVSGSIATLPPGIVQFDVRQVLGGGGTISGNLSDLTGLPLTNFILVGGSHIVTGNISSLPSTLKSFTVYSTSAITGNLKDLPTLVSSCSIYSNNPLSIITYTSGIKIWPTNMSTLDIYIPSSPDITSIDNLVIELAGSTWASITIVSTWGLRLKGTLTNPAAITAAASIAATPTNVTFY